MYSGPRKAIANRRDAKPPAFWNDAVEDRALVSEVSRSVVLPGIFTHLQIRHLVRAGRPDRLPVRPGAGVPARRYGHHFYSMTPEMAGKCAFPLRRERRRSKIRAPCQGI